MLPNVKELPGAKFARSRTLEESHFPRIKTAVNPMPVWSGPLQNGETFFRISAAETSGAQAMRE
jgi:hypothetical protein